MTIMVGGLLVLVMVVLAFAAPLWGADTRDWHGWRQARKPSKSGNTQPGTTKPGNTRWKGSR